MIMDNLLCNLLGLFDKPQLKSQLTIVSKHAQLFSMSMKLQVQHATQLDASGRG